MDKDKLLEYVVYGLAGVFMIFEIALKLMPRAMPNLLGNNEISIFVMIIVIFISIVNHKVSEISRSVKSIRRFSSKADAFDHVAKQIAKAKECIDDVTLSWSDFVPYTGTQERNACEKYKEAMKEACKNIPYREVSSMPKIYLERTESLFGFENYSLVYYDIESHKMPLTSYIIIDKKEVILGFDRKNRESSESCELVLLSLRNSDLVEYYCNNFNSLWRDGTIIKIGTTIKRNEFESIKKKRLNFKKGIESETTNC